MKFHAVKICLCLLFLMFFTVVTAFSQGMWELDLPLPSDDPLWEEVQDCWDNHWDGDNLDELVGVLHRLEEKHPGRIEPLLWLSQVYYLKSRHQRRDRVDHLKASEAYAVLAVDIENDNMTAMKLLITAVSSYADLDYIESTYGDLFMEQLPVPVGRSLPVPEEIPAFEKALTDWDQREDIEKGKKAVAAFEEIATAHPDHLVVQTWAARGNYYLGFYYISIDEQETALPFFKEGNRYGLKALDIDPHYVPAHYWRQLNLARSIQNASIFVKARHMNPIMNHLVFTANENMTYFYCGPLISTATIIKEGGWVAERGMRLAGYTIDTVEMGLELAVIAFPYYFYTHYAKAEVLHHLGRKEEAKALLQDILQMDPYQSPYHAAENICTRRIAGAALEEMRDR